MKIYSDRSLNTLYIEGIDSGPCSDFKVSIDGDRISVYRSSAAIYQLYQVNFGLITNQDGVGFVTAGDCYTYLVGLTVAQFPLRFTVSYPLSLQQNVVGVDQNFMNQEIYLTDGGNF